MGKTGLEQAKQAIMLYKQGHTKEISSDLWRAKKIVDSTLHPGLSFLPSVALPWQPLLLIYAVHRYRGSRFLAVPNVLFRTLELGRDGGHVDTRAWGNYYYHIRL